jgi:hypothetical protein
MNLNLMPYCDTTTATSFLQLLRIPQHRTGEALDALSGAFLRIALETLLANSDLDNALLGFVFMLGSFAIAPPADSQKRLREKS